MKPREVLHPRKPPSLICVDKLADINYYIKQKKIILDKIMMSLYNYDWEMGEIWVKTFSYFQWC